jgi:hypothetical protein
MSYCNGCPFARLATDIGNAAANLNAVVAEQFLAGRTRSGRKSIYGSVLF